MNYVILLECFNKSTNSIQLYSFELQSNFEHAVEIASNAVKELSYLNRIIILTKEQFEEISFNELYDFQKAIFIKNKIYECSLLEYEEISKVDYSILFHSYGKHYFATNEMVYLVMYDITDDAHRIFFFDNENEMKEFFTNTVKNVCLTRQKGEIIMSKIKKSHLDDLIEWQGRKYNFNDYGSIVERCFRFGVTHHFNFYNEKMNQ